MMKNHVKAFGQFINESKQADEVLVVNVDATKGISNSDIRKIEKLEPEQKVKLTGAVSSIASGLYGDLAKRKGNIYKAEEIQQWLENLK